MLNIPLRGDGTIDSDERQILARHRRLDGRERRSHLRHAPLEGLSAKGPPDVADHGNFNESKSRPYTAEDIRFTTKDGRLYAIALGWPADGKLKIKTLNRNSTWLPAEITKVELLGSSAPLQFERTADALVISVPSQKPSDIANAFRITPTTL